MCMHCEVEEEDKHTDECLTVVGKRLAAQPQQVQEQDGQAEA